MNFPPADEIYTDTWFYQLADDMPMIHVLRYAYPLPNRAVINFLINYFGPYRLVRVWVWVDD